MEEIYTAKVKNIKEGTRVGTDAITFVSAMTLSIGKTIKLRKMENDSWNWYRDIASGYVYHYSWLENLEKQMNTPETKYLVVSVRKNDGQTFFPENANHRKGIGDFSTALSIAGEKALNNSQDYDYVVYECTPIASVKLDRPPTKVTFY